MKHNCATSARKFVKLLGRCCCVLSQRRPQKYCRNTGGLLSRCSNLRGGASERGLALFKTAMQTDHPMQTVNAASIKDTSIKDMICIFPCRSVRRIYTGSHDIALKCSYKPCNLRKLMITLYRHAKWLTTHLSY